jgi:uncharacterized coiled-coil protein SlyX
MTKQEMQARITTLETKCDTLRDQALDALRERDDAKFALEQVQKENCPGLLKVIKTLNKEIKEQEGEIKEHERTIRHLENEIEDIQTEKSTLEEDRPSIIYLLKELGYDTYHIEASGLPFDDETIIHNLKTQINNLKGN